MSGKILRDGSKVFFGADEEILDGFFEAGTMGHYVAQSGGFAERGRNLEIDVGVDVAVEVELALLDELHDAGPREEFRNRAGTKERVSRGDGNFLFVIGVPVAFGEERLTILYHRDYRAGDIGLFDLQRH